MAAGEGRKTCGTWAREHRRFCCCSVCFLSLVSVLTGLVCLRHALRSKRLEPLLDLITSSSVCLNADRGVCEMQVSEAAAEDFDLHEHESPLLGFLYGQVVRGAREEMRQVLSGAHIKLQDADGSVYDFLRNLPGASRRISSHRSSRAQYGIPEGKVLSALLVGTLDNSTWLQLEGSPWDLRRPWASIGHILDFIEYGVIRRNVGPLGTTKATDRRPLLAGPPALTAEVCPQRCAAVVQTSSVQEIAPAISLAAVSPRVPVAAEPQQPQLRGAGGSLDESGVQESLVKLGGGVGGAFAAAGGIRISSRFARRLAPE